MTSIVPGNSQVSTFAGVQAARYAQIVAPLDYEPRHTKPYDVFAEVDVHRPNHTATHRRQSIRESMRAIGRSINHYATGGYIGTNR